MFDEARLLDERTLAHREEVLGPQHPLTLSSARNLISDLRGLRRHKQAKQVEIKYGLRGQPPAK